MYHDWKAMGKLTLVINLAPSLNEDSDDDDCSDDSTSAQEWHKYVEVNKVKKSIESEPPSPLQHDIVTTEEK